MQTMVRVSSSRRLQLLAPMDVARATCRGLGLGFKAGCEQARLARFHRSAQWSFTRLMVFRSDPIP